MTSAWSTSCSIPLRFSTIPSSSERSAVAAAARELEEEVGLRPGKLEPIATFWTGPGFTDERMTVFLATACTPVDHAPHGPEEEDAEIVRLPIAELQGMLAADRFEDAKTIVGLQALLQRV